MGKMKSEKGTELVVVDCIAQYRMRYVVEVPIGKTDWALDTVAMEEAREFSQEFLGETIFSHRTIKEKNYEKLFDEDNDYLKDWDLEQKREFITHIKDYQKNDTDCY